MAASWLHSLPRANFLSMSGFEAIASVLQRAATTWPGISFSAAAFEKALHDRMILEAASGEHALELFLATACAAGDSVAIDHFDRTFLARIGVFVARVSKERDFVDEVTQELRIRFFTGDKPKLAQYRAEGPLEGWVRVVAMRTALNLIEAGKHVRHVTIDVSRWSQVLTTFVAADYKSERAQLHPTVQHALTAALEELPSRSKALLRLHFVERLNIEEMGLIYRVHRATVARWLTTIRTQLFIRVEEMLSIRLNVSPSECRSLIDLVRDDLHASLSRILPPVTHHPAHNANLL